MIPETKAKLTAALKPFANVIDAARENVQDWMTAPDFTIGACRRAREALALLSSSPDDDEWELVSGPAWEKISAPDDGEDWRMVRDALTIAREAIRVPSWTRADHERIFAALAIAEKHATEKGGDQHRPVQTSVDRRPAADNAMPAPAALEERARAIIASWLQDCPLVGVRFEESERLQWLIAEALHASESISPSPSLSAPLAGLETTAEEVTRMVGAAKYPQSAEWILIGRLARDIDRLTAALAEAKVEIARRDDLAEAHRAALTEAKVEAARARETELADVSACIRSTAWSGSEEIIAMLRRRIENYRRAHIEKG